ncbi:glycosyltransferase family 1 protein [Rhodococcus kroppenstedtii]|nr:glycosyltransferase family 1 protein [Rhodococcus kroppenstedtii]
MIASLEAAGYRCVVALHDPFGVDLARYTRVIRTHWPAVAATVVDVDDGLPSTAAWIATSWPTAHVLGARPGVGGERFYFVQDYEPYFHPAGSEYALAEDTYRFGFRILALGRMVRDEIARAVGVESTLVPFGLDTTVYRFLGSGPRRGIAFYSRPDTPRRGSVLAGLALDRFHALRPDHPIHLVGDRPPHMTAPVIAHGRLDPDGLAALYNATVCGLGLSFTNSSLVVEEMAACGVQVVVNDAPGARADVTHPGVTWVQPGPSAIANALCAAVDADPSTIAARAQRTADASCMPAWSDAGAVLVEAIERVLTRSGARS